MLLAVFFLACAETRAQEDDLEPWQRHILRTLRQVQESALPEGPRSTGAETRPLELTRPGARDAARERAARRAQRLFGGRVLAVQEVESGFRVRLLQPDGRVKSVRIED